MLPRDCGGGETMKISVVLTTYNRAALTVTAIDSILSQTRLPNEIIVMDDGSTDGTADILRSRFGDRIKLFQQENVGCEGARARAVRLAKGDWIALCDSDDSWHPDHLERLARLADLAPGATLLFSNFRETGAAAVNHDKFASMSGAFWRDVQSFGDDFIDLGENAFTKILLENPVFTSAKMFRKTAHDALGGIDASLNNVLGSDADFTRRLALAGRVACDARITVDILKNGDNMSTDGILVDLGRIEILKKNLSQGGMFRPHEADIRRAISDTACRVMMAAFWHRDMARFRQAAAEVHFLDRPLPLKLRSVVARMPGFAQTMLLSLYPRISQLSDGEGKDA